MSSIDAAVMCVADERGSTELSVPSPTPAPTRVRIGRGATIESGEVDATTEVADATEIPDPREIAPRPPAVASIRVVAIGSTTSATIIERAIVDRTAATRAIGRIGSTGSRSTAVAAGRPGMRLETRFNRSRASVAGR